MELITVHVSHLITAKIDKNAKKLEQDNDKQIIIGKNRNEVELMNV